MFSHDLGPSVNLVIQLLKHKQWIAQGSENKVWSAVHQFYYWYLAQDGSQAVGYRLVKMVNGILYGQSNNANDDDDSDGERLGMMRTSRVRGLT
jgi:hypothetical protein